MTKKVFSMLNLATFATWLCVCLRVCIYLSICSVTYAIADDVPKLARPNIVIVLADDLGAGDVQAINPASTIPTPHLNKIASEGMVFTDAHSNSAVCTPTRYGLLTGRYCWRSRLKRGVLFPPKDEPLIETGRPTIATFLKSHGYQTAMVGKWHLGIGWGKDQDGRVDFNLPIDDGPNEKGFDQWFGVAASLDMIPYSFLRNHDVTQPTNEQQTALKFPRFVRAGPKAKDFNFGDALDTLASEAIGFIDAAAQKDSPFFLYLPLTSPHKPIWPHKRFIGSTELGAYGDFVHQTDDTIGKVLAALKKNNVADNTLVIVTSDNGSYMKRIEPQQPDHLEQPSVQGYRPEHHRANGPWRGTKADIWEAGHHVPFFVRWPKVIKQGTRSERVTSMTDIFATIADIIGQTVPTKAAEDSVSFLPDLKQVASSPRPPIILHSSGGMFAIRAGEWKLVLGNGSGGRENPRGKPFERPYFLANLSDDPGETTNQIEQHPSIAAELEESFKTIAGDHRNSR